MYYKGMEHIAFDRPREKLQAKGVGYLTLVELLQVIIGSGSAKVSGARLAKRAEKLLVGGDPTIDNLQNIQGIGPAKACQIAAAIELGARMNYKHESDVHVYAAKSSPQVAAAMVPPKGKSKLLVSMCDGAYRQLMTAEYTLDHSERIIREVTQGALLAQARIIKISVMSSTLTLDSQLLVLLKQLRSSLLLLDIKLDDVEVVNRKGAKKWKM